MIVPRQAQDGHQQNGAEEEGQGGAQVDGQEVVAVGGGIADAAVETPGGGVHPQGQYIGQRVADDGFGQPAAFGGVGHQEEDQQIAHTRRKQDREADVHVSFVRDTPGAASRPTG